MSATARRSGVLIASLLLTGVVRAASPVIFTDNFESYNPGGLDKNLSGGPNAAPNGTGNPWFGPFPPNARVVTAETPLEGSAATVTPTGGTQMVRGANSPFDFDQNWVNLAYRYNSGQPFTGGLRFDFQFYDPIGAAGAAYDLQDFGSIGYYDTVPSNTDAPSDGSINNGVSVVQRLSLGASSVQDGGFDPNFYQARVVGAADGYDGAGWFNTTAPRSVGWHHMRIDIAPAGQDGTNGVSFYVDNMTTPALTHNSVTNYGYNELELNLNFGIQTAYYDDLALTRLRPGDANVDGTVNADDFALIDKGFAAHLAGWSNGDFNGDGLVDQNDYLIIDAAFLLHGGADPAALLAERESQFGAAYVQELLASVPEPASLAACGFALLPLFSRRRTN